jgi:hypothetical protein
MELQMQVFESDHPIRPQPLPDDGR